jgi:hypothetical protein
MKISELVSELEAIAAQHGDVEVLISDGFDFHFYRGAFVVNAWKDDNGEYCADIGVGGCAEDSEE